MKENSTTFNLKDYEMSLARLVATADNEFYYQQTEDGQYRTYCPSCQRYKTVTKDELRKIQHEHKCPDCGNSFAKTNHTTMQKTYYDSVVMDDDGMDVGISVEVIWRFGKPLEIVRCEKFAEFYTGYAWVRNGFHICGHYYYLKVGYEPKKDNGGWRKSRSPNYYNYSYDFYCNWMYEYGDKKAKAKFLHDMFGMSKSNQIKMVNQYSADRNVAGAIALFDINNNEILDRYWEYIKKNSAHYKDFAKSNIKLNVHYLDYLARNEIDLGMYYAFLNDLKILGFKFEKPTDFAHRFDVVGKMVKDAKDKEFDRKIAELYDSLPTYSDGDCTITPFSTSHEIRRCGKVLHNCIGGFVESYANGNTQLYHLNWKGMLKAAIEIYNGRLKQAKIDNNHECPEEYMYHIRNFCNANNISLGARA